MIPSPREFARWMATSRRKRRLSMSRLAGMVGCNVSTISRIERGLHVPRLDLARTIQVMLDTPAGHGLLERVLK